MNLTAQRKLKILIERLIREEFNQNGMHGEKDFMKSVVDTMKKDYSDLIQRKDWKTILEKIKQDWPSLHAEKVLNSLKRNV